MQRILITGAAGFIGSNLVDALLKAGFAIMGIDNFDPFYRRSVKESNIEQALKNDNFLLREGDIRDAGFIDDCFSGFKPDVVVHLAAKAGVRPSLIDPASYYDVNVMGTLVLLEAMKKYGMSKMIFASSSSVYGNNKKVPFAESDNVDNPISPYAASKKAGELLCYSYHHLYGFNIFCLRFFTVYGQRQRPDLAIHKFIRSMLNDKPITVYGDGSSCRDYTNVEDILQGVTSAIQRVNGYEIINLGESRTISLKNLIRVLEEQTGKTAKLESLPMQDGDVNQTFADISKARKVLDYDPQVDIENGIKDFVSWIKQHGA